MSPESAALARRLLGRDVQSVEKITLTPENLGVLLDVARREGRAAGREETLREETLREETLRDEPVTSTERTIREFFRRPSRGLFG